MQCRGEQAWSDEKRGAGYHCIAQVYKHLASDQIKKCRHESSEKTVLKKEQNPTYAKILHM